MCTVMNIEAHHLAQAPAPAQASATVEKLLRLIKKCKPVLERNAEQDCEMGQLLEELNLLPDQLACLRACSSRSLPASEMEASRSLIHSARCSPPPQDLRYQ